MTFTISWNKYCSKGIIATLAKARKNYKGMRVLLLGLPLPQLSKGEWLSQVFCSQLIAAAMQKYVIATPSSPV